jgi:hypothetical protein
MDWIRSPFEVPMPTQREASPEEPLGAFGSTRVDVDSRMKDSEATGPVLKAGPMAAFTEAIAVIVRAEMVCLVEGIFMKINGSSLYQNSFCCYSHLPIRGKELFYTLSIHPTFLLSGLEFTFEWRNPQSFMQYSSEVSVNSTNNDSNLGTSTDRIGGIAVCSSIIWQVDRSPCPKEQSKTPG